jgi:catechol 2,3-dioxygenase-like lactoylglutathione lyase family enzyme
MLRGMATSTFYADDLEAAKDWYTQFFGIEPYYHVAGGYYEFRIGDYQHEFGIVNRAYAPAGAHNAPGGAIVNWHVDDLQATFDRLLELGATVYDPITPQGRRRRGRLRHRRRGRPVRQRPRSHVESALPGSPRQNRSRVTGSLGRRGAGRSR